MAGRVTSFMYEHLGFEQTDDGGELRRRKPVDQFIGVLFGVGHRCPSFWFSHSLEEAVNGGE